MSTRPNASSLTLTVALSITTVLAAGSPCGQSADDATPVLDRVAERYAQLRTLRAELRQQKFYELLELSDPIESGTLELGRSDEGMSVRLEMKTPQERTLVVHDGEYILYQPRINQAIVGEAEDDATLGSRGFLRYLVGDLEGIEDDFAVENLGLESHAGTELVHLRLLPNTATEVPYRRIDLWVDPDISLPVREELVEANGDRIVVALYDIRLNEPIDDSRFELDLPADVERVQG